MQLFGDGLDEAEIGYWKACGVIKGITTNPLLFRRAGLARDADTLRRLLSCTAPLPTSVQVEGSASDAVREAHELRSLAAHLVVKIPIEDCSGESCLPAINECARLGVPVNVTACVTAPQAIMAVEAGAAYVSLLAGRIRDAGGDLMRTVDTVRTWIQRGDRSTRVVIGSLRSPHDLTELVGLGADVLTVPFAMLRSASTSLMSVMTVRQFLGQDQLPPVEAPLARSRPVSEDKRRKQ